MLKEKNSSGRYYIYNIYIKVGNMIYRNFPEPYFDLQMLVVNITNLPRKYIFLSRQTIVLV